MLIASCVSLYIPEVGTLHYYITCVFIVDKAHFLTCGATKEEKKPPGRDIRTMFANAKRRREESSDRCAPAVINIDSD